MDQSQQYSNWTWRHDIALKSCWYEASELTDIISSMRKINFSLYTEREDALRRLKSLRYNAPFSKTKRFPSDKAFIWEMKEPWTEELQNLRTALSYKNTDDNGEYIVKREGEKIKLFSDTTTLILKKLNGGKSLITLDKFEDHFNLNWQEHKDGVSTDLEDQDRVSTDLEDLEHLEI